MDYLERTAKQKKAQEGTLRKIGDAKAALDRLNLAAEEKGADEVRMAEIRRQRRERRLKEMKGSRKFGKLREIGVSEYVDSIDLEQADIWVVMILTNPEKEASLKVVTAAESCAKKWVHTKFCSIPAKLVQDDFDAVALPAILLYKGGDLVETIMAVPDVLGGDIQESTVEGLLQAHKVLTGAPPAPAAPSGSGSGKGSRRRSTSRGKK